MTAQWYYSSNNEQRGPVSWAKLRELASIGMLKPSDLVWTDGMDEWVKARQQDGLFDRVDFDDEVPESRKTRFTDSKPTLSKSASHDEDDKDTQGDDTPRKSRRTATKRGASAGGMPTALKVLLIVGVVFVLILMVGGC